MTYREAQKKIEERLGENCGITTVERMIYQRVPARDWDDEISTDDLAEIKRNEGLYYSIKF